MIYIFINIYKYFIYHHLHTSTPSFPFLILFFIMSSQASQASSNTPNTESNTESKVKIYDINTFRPTVNDIKILPLKQNKGGLGEASAFKHRSDQFFYIKVQNVVTPFGANVVKTIGKNGEVVNTNPNSPKKYTISIESPVDSAVYECFANLDKCVTEFLINSVPNGNFIDCKNNTNREVLAMLIENNYKSMIKQSSSKKETTIQYPPHVTFSINNSNSNYRTSFYDKNNSLMNVSYEPEDDNFINKMCPPRSVCNLLISVQMFWKTDGKYGLKLQANQIKVYPPSNGLVNGVCVFSDDDDENKNKVDDPSVTDFE